MLIRAGALWQVIFMGVRHGTEKSVQMLTLRCHKVCIVLANSDADGQFFYP